MTEKVKTKQQPIRIGISSCLLGEKVRYDGGHKLDRFLRDNLGQYVEYVPVCPEAECGLGVPREPMYLTGDPDDPRLLTNETGIDLTDRLHIWCQSKVQEMEGLSLAAFVFKSRSPSCGIKGVKVLTGKGLEAGSGTGIFARMFMESFPETPVEDSDRLQGPLIREKFMERVREQRTKV